MTETTATTRISTGELLGRRRDGIDTYLGVPYAEPPVRGVALSRGGTSHALGRRTRGDVDGATRSRTISPPHPRATCRTSSPPGRTTSISTSGAGRRGGLSGDGVDPRRLAQARVQRQSRVMTGRPSPVTASCSGASTTACHLRASRCSTARPSTSVTATSSRRCGGSRPRSPRSVAIRHPSQSLANIGRRGHREQPPRRRPRGKVVPAGHHPMRDAVAGNAPGRGEGDAVARPAPRHPTTARAFAAVPVGALLEATSMLPAPEPTHHVVGIQRPSSVVRGRARPARRRRRRCGRRCAGTRGMDVGGAQFSASSARSAGRFSPRLRQTARASRRRARLPPGVPRASRATLLVIMTIDRILRLHEPSGGPSSGTWKQTPGSTNSNGLAHRPARGHPPRSSSALSSTHSRRQNGRTSRSRGSQWLVTRCSPPGCFRQDGDPVGDVGRGPPHDGLWRRPGTARRTAARSATRSLARARRRPAMTARLRASTTTRPSSMCCTPGRSRPRASGGH